MRLRRDSPQFLPMWGTWNRIYYRGVTKLMNCFAIILADIASQPKSHGVTGVLKKVVEECKWGIWWDHGGGKTKTIDETLESTEQEPDWYQTQNLHREKRKLETTNEKLFQPEARPAKLTREEELNLADYLNIGMSLTKAREAVQKRSGNCRTKTQDQNQKTQKSRQLGFNH